MSTAAEKAGAFSRLERCELKYHVPLWLVEELRHFLKPYCGLDPHSEKSADGFYWVTSLYLDSPRLTFLGWKEQQLPDRYNMRIRAYGKDPAPDGDRFFEIKRKRSDVVTKYRGTMKGGLPGRLWTDAPVNWVAKSDKDRDNLMRFWRCSTQWDARPIVLTQYKRIAWFGYEEEYARVTIDTGMQWREERGYDFTTTGRMRPSGLPTVFKPGTDAVLELKCPVEAVPPWMIDAVRKFNLVRGSFSKFGAAIGELRNILQYDAPVRQPVGVHE